MLLDFLAHALAFSHVTAAVFLPTGSDALVVLHDPAVSVELIVGLGVGALHARRPLVARLVEVQGREDAGVVTRQAVDVQVPVAVALVLRDDVLLALLRALRGALVKVQRGELGAPPFQSLAARESVQLGMPAVAVHQVGLDRRGPVAAHEAAAASVAPVGVRSGLAVGPGGGVGVDVGADGTSAFLQRAHLDQLQPAHAHLGVEEAAEDEDEETLQGVEDAEEVVEDHLGFLDGQRAEDPGDAQQEHDGEGAADLWITQRQRPVKVSHQHCRAEKGVLVFLPRTVHRTSKGNQMV